MKGVLFTVQKAPPLLRDDRSILLTASTTSLSGTPAFSVYSATKAVVRSLARNWILDLKDRHIRVNAVSPGVTETAGRIGRPDEIAKAVLFVASDEASFINGVELFVDGGQAQI